jgi:hypothetical protein
MTSKEENKRPQEEYEGQSVDLYLNEQIAELRVKLEALGNVQHALKSSVLSRNPELIPEIKETILELAKITGPMWRDDKDREAYELEIRRAIKMLDYIR